WLVEVSLARLATELLQQRRPRHAPEASGGFIPTVTTRDGVTSAVAAPHYDGGPSNFVAPAVEWGSSEAKWLS
ncbi:MAG: CoA transferase, partial [Rhodoglobus sp.]